MWDVLLPILLLAGAGVFFAIGFRKIPVLLGLGALVSGLAVIGVKNPEQVGLVIIVAGAAIFWIGLLVYIVYLKLSTRAMLREAEARKRTSS